PHATLLHRPVEEPGKDLAVAVGGLGRQAAAGHLATDEFGDLRRGDAFEAIRLDGGGTTAAVLAGLRRPLAGLVAPPPAVDLELRADRTKDVPEVVDIRLSALGGFHLADVPHVVAHHHRDGRPA